MSQSHLGFWSSTLLTVLGGLINAVFNGIFIADPALGWWGAACCPTPAARVALDLFHTALLLSALTPPLFMALMAALHARTPTGKQSWTRLALTFLSIFTALNDAVYYIQLTAVRAALIRGTAHALAPFIYLDTNSPIFAIDRLGLFFFGLGTLAAIPALSAFLFRRSNREKARMKTTPPHQIARLCDFRAAHSYRQLAFDGWSWRYLAAGNGTRAVLLLPGALVGTEMWFYIIAALQNRYRLIAPEMPSKTLSLSETNAALIKLLEAENTERAIVVGYSAGGGLAQVFVQTHPERVAHLVLSHCTPLSLETVRRVQRVLGLLRVLPLPLIRAIFTARSSRYPATSEWVHFTRAFFAERIATLEKTSLIRFFESGTEAARAFQFEPQALQNWPGKILLLSAKDDSTTFPRLNELQARYPTAQTHIFEQGGHHTVLLFPETYTSALTNFLDGLP